MKYSIVILSFITIAFLACNNTPAPKESPSTKSENEEQLYACPMHPEEIGKKGDKCPKCGMEFSVPVPKGTKPTTASKDGMSGTNNTSSPIKDLVGNYLQLKNAFVDDNSKDAASAGKVLETTFKNFNKSSLTAEQKKVYEDIEDDAREHAEHIGANSGNIEHQREHFVLLSKDIYDLVKIFGAGQPLYKDFCSTCNEGKGAIWLSETKEIKNPYLGKKMTTNGSLQEEIK